MPRVGQGYFTTHTAEDIQTCGEYFRLGRVISPLTGMKICIVVVNMSGWEDYVTAYGVEDIQTFDEYLRINRVILALLYSIAFIEAFSATDITGHGAALILSSNELRQFLLCRLSKDQIG
ncbi:hypothetical protein PoB_003774600 [Plakobranchus ocellatus]|uniref:Uncharacterized protein n=1 Tax=Plakobranchus ocellatus TaxID=259542 RepID=A0AAV4ASY1_9GAST|nr:hypothetical protein PoB_003774600 [Plakobranchus ocellatus]